MERIENFVFIVRGSNGIILTQEEGIYTTDVKQAKIFPTIGDAMRACVKCNYETPFFKVASLEKETMQMK